MLPETVSLVDCFTIVGLVFDIFGVTLIFLFAPEKKPHPQFGSAFKVENHYVEEWEKNNRNRNWRTKGGLALIILGFSIQAVGAALF